MGTIIFTSRPGGLALKQMLGDVLPECQQTDIRLFLLDAYRSTARGAAEHYWLEAQKLIGDVEPDCLAAGAAIFLEELLKVTRQMNVWAGVTDARFDAERVQVCEAVFAEHLDALMSGSGHA